MDHKYSLETIYMESREEILYFFHLAPYKFLKGPHINEIIYALRVCTTLTLLHGTLSMRYS
jgi:hypothetical protein